MKFSQKHKVGNVGIIVNFDFSIYLQFSSFFLHQLVLYTSKCEIGNQGVYNDYISRLHASLNHLIFDGKAKTKLAILAFLYCGGFVKNSTR